MRTTLSVAALVVLITMTTQPALGDAVSGQDAFAQLKMLAGTWSGSAAGEGSEAAAEAADEIAFDIRVSAAGSVVMETMDPGGDHEMINMYHLDGDDLVLTHYCASGNQPTMRLDREASSAEKLVFVFTGGTNMDPAVDPHIHDAEITLVDADQIVSTWRSFAGGEHADTMTFKLARD